FEQTIQVTGPPNTQTKKTTNYPGNTGGPSGAEIPPYAITDGTTHYWKVSYDSTNPLQDDSVSACEESTDVEFAGDDSTITVP
ncbi:MAG TPA: hypothetical protein VGJ61_01465, partial [Solirubrobacterales bacterium]